MLGLGFPSSFFDASPLELALGLPLERFATAICDRVKIEAYLAERMQNETALWSLWVETTLTPGSPFTENDADALVTHAVGLLFGRRGVNIEALVRRFERERANYHRTQLAPTLSATRLLC
jgi:hypothetical protein